MAYEQKDGAGSLFKNDKKEAEQHPDYRGSIKVAGVEYWLSAWIKQSKGGKKYMSLSAQSKQAVKSASYKAQDAAKVQAAAAPEFDDEWPM